MKTLKIVLLAVLLLLGAKSYSADVAQDNKTCTKAAPLALTDNSSETVIGPDGRPVKASR